MTGTKSTIERPRSLKRLKEELAPEKRSKVSLEIPGRFSLRLNVNRYLVCFSRRRHKKQIRLDVKFSEDENFLKHEVHVVGNRSG